MKILGIADSSIIKKLKEVKFDKKKGLVICDIEVGEFNLFTESVFDYLNVCKIIIELHYRVLGLDGVREKLISTIPKNCEYKIIKSKPVDWSDIHCLEELSDNDRALSEGRRMLN